MEDPVAFKPPLFSLNGDLDTNSSDTSEGNPFKVYKRRWLVLGMFSLLSFTNSVVWITWSSISESARLVFGWDDGTIALLLNWGNVPYVLFSVPICWYLTKHGLRKITVLATMLMVLGSGLRCVTFEPRLATPLIHSGQLLNGIASVVFNSLPSGVSAVWFPTHERTTATSVMVTASTLGVAAGYFLGPQVVHAEHCNATEMSTTLERRPHYPCHNDSHGSSRRQKKEIVRLMFYEFFSVLALFVVVLLGFREKPPSPPTASATLERLDMADSFRALKGNLNFWIVALGFALTNGISSNWLGILGPALKHLDVDQDEASKLGTYSTLVGCLFSLLISRFVDMVGGHIKLCLLGLWLVCGSNFVVYTCMYLHVIPHPPVLLYVTVTITGILAYAVIPLYMELSAEISYPVSEGFVGVVLQTMVNIVGSGFLAIFLIPHIGVGWMNWCLIGSAVVGTILVILQKEDYQRSNFDLLASEYQVVPEP